MTLNCDGGQRAIRGGNGNEVQSRAVEDSETKRTIILNDSLAPECEITNALNEYPCFVVSNYVWTSATTYRDEGASRICRWAAVVFNRDGPVGSKPGIVNPEAWASIVCHSKPTFWTRWKHLNDRKAVRA